MDQITEFLTYQYKTEWTSEAKRIREDFTNIEPDYKREKYMKYHREVVFDSFWIIERWTKVDLWKIMMEAF